MELALSHYRRIAELYHAAASGNFDSKETTLAELGVKRGARDRALQGAVGSAAGHVMCPNALRLSASGCRDIRETVELLFATEWAQSRNDLQYKAGRDMWVAIFLHDSLK